MKKLILISAILIGTTVLFAQKALPIPSNYYLIGTFQGVQLGCSWGEPTTEVTNPGTMTFNADGTLKWLNMEEFGEGYTQHWELLERDVEHWIYIYVNNPCETFQHKTTADVVKICIKDKNGDCLYGGSHIRVFKYGDVYYIDNKRYRKISQ
ncbi:MAG: hypothetical protein LBP96_03125 [Bacteroidales bacterium]|jgi:hypothetical protein|nr:hypothetical protein [Bacteroidales bacterium]